MTNASTASRLAQLLEPSLAECGVDLEDLDVVAAGKRRLVRVLIDKDGGVSLDDIAFVSQRISALLDADLEADALLGSAAYVLEVGSPGVDRPLTHPRHWRRAVGRLVRVVGTDGDELTGRLISADDEVVRLALGGSSSDETTISLDDVKLARVQVEFNRRESSNVCANDVQLEETP